MPYAVIWLIDAKKRVAIEIDWVKDIFRARLWNNGKNSNQNFLMFWSSKDDIPNFGERPRFSAPIANEYFSTCDGVCYLGRIENFFGKNIFFYPSTRKF